MSSRSLLVRALVRLSALGAIAVSVLPSTALAGDHDRDRDDDHGDRDDDHDIDRSDAALFARFTDLTTPATRDRHDALIGNRATAAAMASITELLDDGATASALEGDLLPLIAGQLPEDVETTLNALMLDLYLEENQEDLAAGDTTLSAVFDRMMAQDEVLTTAAYGASAPPAAGSARRVNATARPTPRPRRQVRR